MLPLDEAWYRRLLALAAVLGRVDQPAAPSWIGIAAVSAVTGASLGPSFSLVIIGGAVGSWLAARRWTDDEARLDYTLTGMAGGLGGAFTSPILGMFMVSELAPVPRHRYVATVIPQSSLRPSASVCTTPSRGGRSSVCTASRPTTSVSGTSLSRWSWV